MRRITSRFALLLAAAGILPLLVYGAVSIFSLREATQKIRHHRQRERRAACCRANWSVRSDQRRHSSISRRHSQKTRISTVGSRIASSRMRSSTFPEFREVTLYDAAAAQLASSRVGQSKLQFPQSGTTFGSNITVSPIDIDGDLLPTSDRRHQIDQGRPKLRLARRRDQPRGNVADGRSDQSRRAGLCARRRVKRPVDRPWQPQRKGARRP